MQDAGSPGHLDPDILDVLATELESGDGADAARSTVAKLREQAAEIRRRLTE
jgi:hypothetical protein